MKNWLLLILLLSRIVCAQTTLPQNWVNPYEFVPPVSFDVTCTLGGGTCSGSSNSYAATRNGMQQAICDWVAAPDQWWLIKVPHGTVITTSTPGYTCTQGSGPFVALTLVTKIVSGARPTKFIVFDSDTPLPVGQTVCSHGITDSTGTRQPPTGATNTWWTGSNFGCANDRGSMWTLDGNWVPGNLGQVIQVGTFDAGTNLGPSYYAFKNVEIRPDPTSSSSIFVVGTNVVASGGSVTQASQFPSHIHFQNIYGHGDAIDCVPSPGCTAIAGNNVIATFMHLDGCQFCSIEYSYFDYITRVGAEGHVIAIPRTNGPVKVAHNWVSGASSAMFIGGISATDPFYLAQDVEVRANRLTNPPSWWANNANWTGVGPFIKNRLEWKACNRCLADGNIGEYVDLTGQQSGQVYTLTPRACSAGLQCDNYQLTLQNLTLTNNVGRHALTALQTAGRSDYPSNGGGAAGPLRNINFSNNLFYDLGNGALIDPTTIVAFPYFIRPISFGQAYICNGSRSGTTITLTCVAGPTGLLQIQISPGDLGVVTNCSDSTWNVPGSNYPTTKGAIALAGTTPGGLTFVYSNAGAVASSATNCILSNGEGIPSNFTVVHNTVVMSTTNGGKNNARIFEGSTATVPTDQPTGTGCTGPVHNSAITALSRDGTGTIVTATLASTTGWLNLTAGGQVFVEVSGVTPADFNGTFYYLGLSAGNPTWAQVGTANETGSAFGSAQQMGSCVSNNFAQASVWKNNLLAVDTPLTGWGGWVAQGGGNLEGCRAGASSNNCSENQVDTTNSVVTFNDFPGRTAANYMEVGGANAGSIPPVTLSFPAATVCSGLTATSACVGMLGMMNGVGFDSNDANYHNYGLVVSSSYHLTADDSTDYGVNFATLDAAQTSTIYSGCSTNPAAPNYCGPTGPFADVPPSVSTVTISGVSLSGVVIF